MKIIQIPFCFYPDLVGGTEVYVEALSRNLQSQGVDIIVVSPGSETKTYFHNQLKVRRFKTKDKLSLSQLYKKQDPEAREGLARILEEEKPDIVHMHSFTSASSAQSVIEAKRRGIRVFFTYHTPAASCQRGTLMYRGKSVCDGRLILHKCSRCTLHGLGLNRLCADIIGSLPPFIGKILGGLRLEGGPWTALRMSELIEYHFSAFNSFVSEVDHVVAVCKWAKDILTRNGVPEEKITVIRQGLSQQIPVYIKSGENKKDTLKLAFLGRLHPTKGLDIIVKALKKIPDILLKLDVYGIIQDNGTYYEGLLKIAAGDNRISFKESIPAERVLETLKSYDYLVAPSQWLETGPMVVLEAFAAGIPVIGSRLGGIAEIVKDGVDAILVEPDDIAAWASTLKECFSNRELRYKLQQGIRKPITMEYVSMETKKLYDKKNIIHTIY